MRTFFKIKPSYLKLTARSVKVVFFRHIFLAASTEKAYHRDFKYVNLPGISASYKHENYIDARQNVCAYLPTI